MQSHKHLQLCLSLPAALSLGSYAWRNGQLSLPPRQFRRPSAHLNQQRKTAARPRIAMFGVCGTQRIAAAEGVIGSRRAI